jgi:hypothetical protein
MIIKWSSGKMAMFLPVNIKVVLFEYRPFYKHGDYTFTDTGTKLNNWQLL